MHQEQSIARITAFSSRLKCLSVFALCLVAAFCIGLSVLAAEEPSATDRVTTPVQAEAVSALVQTAAHREQERPEALAEPRVQVLLAEAVRVPAEVVSVPAERVSVGLSAIPERLVADTTPQSPGKKTETTKPAPAKKAASKVRLFKSVEFKGPLKNLPAWLSVMDRNAKKPIFTENSKLNSRTTWGELKAQAEKLPPLEQLRLVNRFWNQWPYREDSSVYKKNDYWAIPDEFRKNSGDCEDYAIAKYFTLRALGYPASQMRIVVLMETIRNQAHAVLVVFLDGDAYVLDNLSMNILSHTRYPNYEPQFSVNEEFRWAHVRPK